MTGASLLDRVVERVPLAGHDGRSGARLERIRLDDGTRLVVKRTSPAVDLVMRLTGGAGSRERLLWQAGVLDRLPRGLGHALVDAWQEGDETVLVMRDLGDTVVGWHRTISREECRGLWAAVTSMHRRFAGETPAGLVPLADRISLFAPTRMRAEVASGHPLPVAVLKGWERFAEIVSPDVAAAVLGVLDRPRRLAGPLSRRPSTLIHGDLWLVNVAFEPAQVTLLDWDLATWAPPALELALFLDGNSSQVRAGRDEVVTDFRDLWGDDGDEVALRLALFAGLADLGWNKALDATGHPDPAVRSRERADLDWWVAQSRATLEQGLVDD
ncbi:MAG TPA: phosphotransferase [Acidimicrobiales bacterium]|nr:phosphotransferase [Acidimicrobiales bacterium]